ncbi:MAG: LptF/LptG family permease [Spirochaetota bacterium]
MKVFPGKTYTRFLVIEFLKVFFVCLIFIMGLSFIVRTLQSTDTMKTYPFTRVLLLRALEAPEIISREALLASCMFASVYTVSMRTKNREVLALRSCGVSVYRVISPLIVMGFLICVASLLFEDCVVVKSFILKDRYLAHIRGDNPREYLRDQYDLIVYGEGGVIYKIDHFIAKSKEMKTVVVVKRRSPGVVQYRIDAEKAKWKGGFWTFYNGIKLSFGDDGSVKEHRIFSEMPTEIRDDPQYFGKETRKIENMTLKEGYRYIMVLRKMGLEYRPSLTRFHRKIANSFTLFLIVLIGLSLGSMKFRNALVISFAMTIGVVLVFFFIIEIGYTFGSSGKVYPLIGGWLGNILFSIVGFFLLRRIRI